MVAVTHRPLRIPRGVLTSSGASVERVTASAFTVPTDQPESDGTLAWDSTTLVLVEATGGGGRGLGYTYTGPAAASAVTGEVAQGVTGRGAATPPAPPA